jgi:hypothetical protein
MYIYKSAVKTLLLVPMLIMSISLSACEAAVLEVGIEPTPAPTLLEYVNPDYGFMFNYPATWELTEGTNFLRLNQGTLALNIGYKWASEQVDLSPGRTGLPAGDMIYGGKVTFLGQVVPVEVLEFERKDKAVFYQINNPVQAGDYPITFAIWLEDSDGQNYLNLDIPKTTQAEVAAVLESFSTVSPLKPPADSSANTPPDQGTPINGNELAPVVGWYGSVSAAPSGTPYNYLLELLPEGTGKVGLIIKDPNIQNQIEAISDKGPPNKYANFWGTLNCSSGSDGICSLLVARMRPDGPGPLFDPDPVEGWEGKIITNPAWAQIDDAFVLTGNFGVQYGIWSEDPNLDKQIISLRDTDISTRVWGKVTCGVMDANGCQIVVSRIEIEE